MARLLLYHCLGCFRVCHKHFEDGLQCAEALLAQCSSDSVPLQLWVRGPKRLRDDMHGTTSVVLARLSRNRQKWLFGEQDHEGVSVGRCHRTRYLYLLLKIVPWCSQLGPGYLWLSAGCLVRPNTTLLSEGRVATAHTKTAFCTV